MSIVARCCRILILLITCVMFCSPVTSAEPACVIRVPTDYATIAEAVIQASAGAIIQVASGRYNETIPIEKPLTIRGNKASEVIIGGTHELAGIYIGWDDVTIENITSIRRLSTYAQKRTTVRNCILKHPIAFLGRDNTLDRCIIVIPQPPPLDRPLGSPAGGRVIGMDYGYGCVMSNNLLLEARTRGAGHFEGQPPPVVTPTPTVPCTGLGCPSGPALGFASIGGGVFASGDAQIINNTIVNVHGGDTGYLTLNELEDWSYLYPGYAFGITIGACRGTRIANNIIWNVQGGEALFPHYDGTPGSKAVSIGIHLPEFKTADRAIVENNLLFEADYGIAVEVQGSTAGLTARNNYWAYPGFVNPASGDYRLLPNSPAIDAGTPVA